MASINRAGSSNTVSSLYNSANVISGLASGLDTEGMIENLVQSYQTKIQTLNNKATKLGWKQDAYRSIIAKMNAFSNKYTSYTSSTNLMSASFFNSAVNVAAQGANKDKVTASGKTESDVKLNAISQLASVARYTTSSNLKGVEADFAITGDGVDFAATMTRGTLSGSMGFAYGGKTISITFDPDKDIIPDTKEDGTKLTAEEKAGELVKLINKKLADSKVTLSSGESRNADELIDVTVSNGKISFADKTSGGNTVYISSASDDIKNVLGLNLDNAKEDKPAEIDMSKSKALTKEPSVASLISGKAMNVSLDGKTKTIYMPQVSVSKNDKGEDVYTITPATMVTDKDGNVKPVYEKKNAQEYTKDTYADAYAEALDEVFQKEFNGKISVKNEGTDGQLKLRIEAPENSNMIVNTDAGKALGIGNIATNYLNTSKTLGELMPNYQFKTDYDGKEIKQDFVINGVTIGSYGKDTKLSDILNDINSNSAAGVKVTYSQTTRKFSFASKETGSDAEVKLGGGLATAMFGEVDTGKLSEVSAKDVMGVEGSMAGKQFSFKVGDKAINYTVQGSSPTVKHVMDALNGELKKEGYTAELSKADGSLVIKDKDGNQVEATDLNDDTKALFSGLTAKASDHMANYTEGKDAKFIVEVNGQEMEMTRPSNNVDIDGMTLNFKGTFNDTYKIGDELETEAVTFNTSTDSDKIVDAVKAMIADYNEMMSEIRTQYATLPYQSSSGAFQSYEPLTDEDKATMSESAIQAYEEKAKQGQLFGDRNLSRLYEQMRSIFSPGGKEEQLLQQMGISTTYSSVDNSASITLDESKLRAMLDSDPDAVADVFTRSSTAGGSTDGIMQKMKNQLDIYAGLTGATKGILVQQAGTPLSSLTLMNNTWQNQIDDINEDIEKWQDKLSSQVDKYTSMFSKLETLIYQMNSQSSTLAGLMGG